MTMRQGSRGLSWDLKWVHTHTHPKGPCQSLMAVLEEVGSAEEVRSSGGTLGIWSLSVVLIDSVHSDFAALQTNITKLQALKP